jgi:hypothetical protein
MVKMVELIVTDADGRVLNRVAVNEDLFKEVLKRVRERPHDLATAWYLRILGAIFNATTALGSVTASYVDTTGTSRTQTFKTGLGGSTLFFNTGACNNRLFIVYGNSSTAPTRSDYRLGNELGEGVAGVTVDEDAGILTISGSFTFATGTVIYEVGLEWEATVSGANVCGRVLLDRTVIPGGIAVAAGQTLTVVYRFIFP